MNAFTGNGQEIIAGWRLYMDEVSNGVYRVKVVDAAGWKAETTGTNPQSLSIGAYNPP
ncbi:hypothetical protein [Hymenobacter koreensis]|uniref:Uncharacterized protein n=1 Tax=Hymenobacter koreensis TaxID=1084523 RepID=A0ABP8JM25_9BACT